MNKSNAVPKASTAISEERLWKRHMDMAAIGATPGGGVNRQALTQEDFESRSLLVGWGKELGFKCSMDAIGNIFVSRSGVDINAISVMSGSHLDTQPNGGRFDGIFGVLAAFEALQAIDEVGILTKRPIEIVVWTNEEGSRFQPGCMGSLAFVQPDQLETLLAVKDDDGVEVRSEIPKLKEYLPDLDFHDLDTPLSAFIEAHIEQGPILEQKSKTIGVVSGIQGTRRFTVQVYGEDAHSGTTPRGRRKDALSSAVSMVTALEKIFHNDPEDILRFTVGRFDVSPNSPFVVPGHVRFSIDFRHPSQDVLNHLGDKVEGICQSYANNCTVDVTEISSSPSIEFDGLVPNTILEVVQNLDIPHMSIYSGAGHDAQNFSDFCPTGMIFVPCEKGISHNERENATPSDLAAGARVLADTIVELANR
ncbi:MAG: M20 family metallo-hydrolase [Alphaproteobacteria bacterium]|nr:M20 family metallo-hydrolase [Alphaproteobacteria bacterium]